MRHANLVRIQHGYDRAGNRLWRKDLVAESFNAGLDELYSYDGLYRLRNVNRGTLNTTQTAIQAGTGTFNQCWTLDSTGNWKGFREDDTGSGTWNLVQSRTANTVNEITGIANSVGSAWANPVYDHAGNMTTIPQPAAPSSSYAGTYDAWNRLVKLVDNSSSQTVQTNAYDGRNYRVIRDSYTSGALSETRHYFYTAEWQDIEERVGTSTDPNRQFVWSHRYIDALIIRDRDIGTGSLTERLYNLQDAKWNIVASMDVAGTVQERYAYQAYGSSSTLTPGFGNRLASTFAFEVLFTGSYLDVASGLYMVRYRPLHPLLGVWLIRDLIKASLLSLHEYVRSSPLTFGENGATHDNAGRKPLLFRKFRQAQSWAAPCLPESALESRLGVALSSAQVEHHFIRKNVPDQLRCAQTARKNPQPTSIAGGACGYF